jgi:hypothetical protein
VDKDFYFSDRTKLFNYDKEGTLGQQTNEGFYIVDSTKAYNREKEKVLCFPLTDDFHYT